MTVDTQRYALRGIWRARWVATAWCALLFSVYDPAIPVPQVAAGIGSTGYLLLSNVALWATLRSATPARVRRGALGVVLGDTLLLTAALLLFASDPESQDLWTLLLIPLVEAALLLELRGALVTATAAPVILLVHLQVGEVPRSNPVLVDLVYRLGLLLVAATMVALLADSLRRVLAELAQAREAATHRSLHDPLTGLPIRSLFDQCVARALADPPPAPAVTAVLFVDLDDFKAVNDSLGHQAGDELLVAVADRLRAVTGPGGTAARFGGDEFAVLVGAVDPGDVGLLTERLLAAVQRPVRLGGTSVSVPASVGVALAAPGTDAAALLADADAAMYDAKSSGKGGWRLFAPPLREEAERRLRLRGDLAHAAERGQLGLMYQPIVDLDSARIAGVEALLRWRHPTQGLLEPDAFVPLAEETGLIVPIGRWVLAEACGQARDWDAAHPAAAGLDLHVNVSGVQLRQAGLVDEVAAVLATSGLPPHRLVLELTESVPLLSDDRAPERVAALRALGVRVALDDFGTGYATLSWLQRFPVDMVKVARDFVAGLGRGPAAEALAGGILGTAAAMGIGTVAEGVETDRQVARLRALGCARGQGHLFGDALPAAGITALLAAARAPQHSGSPSGA
jgi:diguanylate cyclase (GGDEF)-like protein